MNRHRIAIGSAIAAAAATGALFVPALASAHEKDPVQAQAKKDCLAAAGITKPERGVKPTQEQRDALKAALAACGIEIKARGTGTGTGGHKFGGGKRGGPRQSAPATPSAGS